MIQKRYTLVLKNKLKTALNTSDFIRINPNEDTITQKHRAHISVVEDLLMKLNKEKPEDRIRYIASILQGIKKTKELKYIQENNKSELNKYLEHQFKSDLLKKTEIIEYNDTPRPLIRS